MSAEKVLIVESDPNTLELASLKLSKAGYFVLTATSSDELIYRVANNPPDLIVINPGLADGKGYTTCAALTARVDSRNIPILLLIDERFDEEKLKSGGVKAAGRLVKPFKPRSLLTQVNNLISKMRLIRQMNPVTQLPGLFHLEEKMGSLLQEKQRFNLVFCDLKGFKPYNKQYGYEEGNRVIKFMAGLIREEFNQTDCDAEIFHLGADKFAVLISAASFEDITDRIIQRFNKEIPVFYRESDQARGGLVITNRQGIVEQWPMVTIVLAIVTNECRMFNNWLEIEAVGAELIKFAKTMAGSQVVRDRRCS